MFSIPSVGFSERLEHLVAFSIFGANKTKNLKTGLHADLNFTYD